MKWIPLTFFALALAGCAENSEPDAVVDPNDPEFVPVGLQAPVWNVGDMWEYSSSGGDLRLVVTSDEGSDYTLDTNNTNIAFFEDRFDISYIGPITKSHLQGRQGNSMVHYFDFPLYDQKTWTSTWDGETYEMTAHDQGNEVFHIMAHNDDVMVNQYQYSNATKFWDWISFGDPEGNEVFRMDLVSRSSGWTGELIRIEATSLQDYSTGGQTNTALSYTLPDTEGDLYLELNYSCGTGPYVVAIGPVEGIPSQVTGNENGFSASGNCPVDEAIVGIIGTTPTTDNWGHAWAGMQTIEGNLWARQYEYISL